MTETGVRVARLYDGFDPQTGPYFAPDRRRVDDPAERRRIVRYLRGGTVLLRSFTLDPDVLDPGRGAAVPGSFRTDGSWLWSDGLMYYVERHGIAPPVDFHEHMAAAGYRCPAADPVALREAGETLDRLRH